MFLIASLFFGVIYQNVISESLANDYLAGAIILGAAPCTAMVFVWSQLTKGDAAYTLVQVATNNLILLVLFVPIVGLLLGIGGFTIPWMTLFLSVVLFVVVPLTAASITRTMIISHKGIDYLDKRVIPKFSKITMIGLLLTLVLIFSLQSDLIIDNPLHIVLISVPLVIQTLLIFTITYFIARKIRLNHEIAAPAGFINPGVALATIVGVLVEVPVMLFLVKVANKTKKYFNKGDLSYE
jgi:ACR3 family arsenite transporter